MTTTEEEPAEDIEKEQEAITEPENVPDRRPSGDFDQLIPNPKNIR